MSHHEDERARGTISGIWADGFGRVALRCVQILAVVLVAVGVVYGLVTLSLVVLPVLLALIIAAAVSPLTRLLRRFLPPAAAAAGVLVIGVLVFGGVITLIVSAVQSQWDGLREAVGRGIEQVQGFIQSNNLPFDITDDQIEQARTAVLDFFTSSSFGSGALAGVSAVGNFFAGFAVFVVVLFFFMKDGRKIADFLLGWFRGENRARAERVGTGGLKVFGEYVRGTATIAAVDTIGIGIGLLILQVPLAAPLLVIVFVGAFVPIVGATAAGVLAALVALAFNGLPAALWIVAIVILVNQLEGNLLQPVVMGNAVKLHPLVILVALTIGTILGGIVGAILAVPLTAVAWTAVKNWNPAEPTPPTSDMAKADQPKPRGLLARFRSS